MSGDHPKSAVLGIDFGSTAIRAILVPRDNLPEKRVWNRGAIPGFDERYQQGAFKSSIYVDDKGDPYLGEDTDDDRVPIPSKFFFLEHPQTGVDSVDSILNGPNGQEKLRILDAVAKGTRAILRAVLEQSVETCEQKSGGGPFHVDAISLSYSAHWNENERNNYQDIFLEVLVEFDSLNKHTPEMHMVPESLSSAHSLFADEKHMDQVLGQSTEPSLLVVLDFGGHTLNGCMFSVARRPSRDLCYLRVGDTFAIRGGTQLWEQAIERILAEAFLKDSSQELPPKQRAELLESFHSQIKRWKSNNVCWLGLPYTSLDGERNEHVHLTQDEVAKSFWAAMSKPTDLAAEKIAEACTMSNKVKVVVSGGSGKSSVVRGFIRDICAKANVSEPYFFYENAGPHDSWNIAKGAAICAANSCTVEEFIELGAAFGFQKSSRVGRMGNQRDIWSSDVRVVLNSRISQSSKVYFSGTSRIRLICSPSQALDSGAPASTLDLDTSYDILELPTPPTGYWEHSLRLENSGGAISFIVKRNNWGRCGKHFVNSREFPPIRLFFDNPSNCCLIETDICDEGRGLMMLESGKLQACPESTFDDQTRELQYAQGRRPPKRRKLLLEEPVLKKRRHGTKPHRAMVFDPAKVKPKCQADSVAVEETAQTSLDCIFFKSSEGIIPEPLEQVLSDPAERAALTILETRFHPVNTPKKRHSFS